MNHWEGKAPRGKAIRVDGALVAGVLRIPFGYREAKDIKRTEVISVLHSVLPKSSNRTKTKQMGSVRLDDVDGPLTGGACAIQM